VTRRALSHVGACGTGTAGAYNGCWVGICVRVLACRKNEEELQGARAVTESSLHFPGRRWLPSPRFTLRLSKRRAFGSTRDGSPHPRC